MNTKFDSSPSKANYKLDCPTDSSKDSKSKSHSDLVSSILCWSSFVLLFVVFFSAIFLFFGNVDVALFLLFWSFLIGFTCCVVAYSLNKQNRFAFILIIIYSLTRLGIVSVICFFYLLSLACYSCCDFTSNLPG